MNNLIKKATSTNIQVYFSLPKIKNPFKNLDSPGFDVTAGRWNDLETLLLLVVYEVLEISDLHGVSHNIVTLYNFVAGSSQVAQMELDIIAKRSAQITGKLSYLK